jgi:hypothetical protein
MQRILLLLTLAVCFSSAFSDQASDEVAVIDDVVYGHDFGMAMTFDVYIPSNPNGAGVILINSGGWESPFDTFKVWTGDTYRYATAASRNSKCRKLFRMYGGRCDS